MATTTVLGVVGHVTRMVGGGSYMWCTKRLIDGLNGVGL